jgi:hypothetical protein
MEDYMINKSILSSIGKWLAGIAAMVIGAVLVWWLTQERPPEIMDVSGVWLTPFNNLSYKVTQDPQDKTKGVWVIQENGLTGTGTIISSTLLIEVGGQKVEYVVGEYDSEGNPTVLFTVHSNYLGVILFRTCDDFKKYLTNLEKNSPQAKTKIYDALKNLPNPTCPNGLP